ncbi:MAG: GtrA family protein [Amphiplicatus sp.]
MSPVFRFLIVGGMTVLLDLIVYRAFAFIGVDVHAAKGIGFVAGTLFAYFANRLYTFSAKGGAAVFMRFLALYATTLGCNVAVNAAALFALSSDTNAVTIAFLIATGVSATLNFLGMKHLVFRRKAVG